MPVNLPKPWILTHVARLVSIKQTIIFHPHFLHGLPLMYLFLSPWKRGRHCFQVKEPGWSCKSCCSQAGDYSFNEWFTLPSHQPLLLSDWFRWHSCRPSAGQKFRFITCRRLQWRASPIRHGQLITHPSLFLDSVCVPKLYGNKCCVNKVSMMTPITERSCSVVGTPASCSVDSGFKSRRRELLYWLRLSWLSSVPSGKYRDGSYLTLDRDTSYPIQFKGHQWSANVPYHKNTLDCIIKLFW
jgi:hypothetical protein